MGRAPISAHEGPGRRGNRRPGPLCELVGQLGLGARVGSPNPDAVAARDPSAASERLKFLHQHPDLSSRIRQLRTQQMGGAENAHEATTAGESAVIAALRRQLREQKERHRAEAKDLRVRLAAQERQIAILYGQLGQR